VQQGEFGDRSHVERVGQEVDEILPRHGNQLLRRRRRRRQLPVFVLDITRIVFLKLLYENYFTRFSLASQRKTTARQKSVSQSTNVATSVSNSISAGFEQAPSFRAAALSLTPTDMASGKKRTEEKEEKREGKREAGESEGKIQGWKP